MYTALALRRAREADHRVKEYHRLFPQGDKDHYRKWEDEQWKLAELKILSP